MKKCITSIFALTLCFAAASPTYARDVKHLFAIAPAMESKDAQAKLDSSMKVFFGKQPTPQVLKPLRKDAARGKANIRDGSMEQVCNAAFVSALVALQKHAKQLSANAIVDTVSYYKKVEMSSATQFECHEGTFTVGVALRGDFATVPDK